MKKNARLARVWWVRTLVLLAVSAFCGAAWGSTTTMYGTNHELAMQVGFLWTAPFLATLPALFAVWYTLLGMTSQASRAVRAPRRSPRRQRMA